MRARRGGRIVNVASISGRQGTALLTAYCAAKHGVVGLTRNSAVEYGEFGIRVNAIAPGAIRTPINKEAWETEAALTKLLKLIPYGRIGEPEDVARAAVWLASDAADYVTGTTVFVDGGMSLYPEFRDNG
jgi:glucose 1-dehydrogenase